MRRNVRGMSKRKGNFGRKMSTGGMQAARLQAGAREILSRQRPGDCFTTAPPVRTWECRECGLKNLEIKQNCRGCGAKR